MLCLKCSSFISLSVDELSALFTASATAKSEGWHRRHAAHQSGKVIYFRPTFRATPRKCHVKTRALMSSECDITLEQNLGDAIQVSH